MKDIFIKIKTWKEKGDFGFSLVFVLAAFFIFSSIIFISQAFAKSEKDIVNPHIPQGLEVKTKPSGFDISWHINSDKDVTDYLIYVRTSNRDIKDIKPIIVSDDTHYVLEDLKPETTYYISLAAKDKAGNTSDLTSEIGLAPDLSKSEKEYSVAGWMPVTDLESSHNTFKNNLDLFDIISPFERKLEADGSITKVGETFNSELAELAAFNQIKVVPTITNNFDKDDVGSNLLLNEDLVNNHINQIINLVEDNNYDGIDLDYEGLKPEVKEQFTNFIKNLADDLHARDKILIVTVQAKKDDNNTWRGPGAMDYEELGKAADQIRIMAYDYSRLDTKPGAIAPIHWFEEVIKYTKKHIPQEKIIAGLPNYGYKWCLENKLNCEKKGLVYEGVENIINDYNISPEWNNETMTPWFVYSDEQENIYAVNYENYKSLEAKLEIVQEEEVGGLSIWRLGSEDPENYKVIDKMAGKQLATPKEIVITPQDEQIKIALKKEDKEMLKGYRIKAVPKEEIDTENNSDEESLNFNSDEKNSQEINDTSEMDPYFKDELYKGTKEKSFDLINEEEYIITNLENNQPYFISIIPLTISEDNNFDYVENIEHTKLILATPEDLSYPGTIKDLKVEDIGNTTINISFSASGDDYFEGQADKYEIRYSNEPFDKDNFKDAKIYAHVPKPEGSKIEQLWQLRELVPGNKYYIGLRSFDENNNPSDISNVVFAETIDNVPPAKPSPPILTASDKAIYLTWNKSEEEDLAGYKLYWQQERSYFQIISFDKDQQDYLLNNLENGYQYNFSILAFDERGNESAKSETISISPQSSNIIARTKNNLNVAQEKLKAHISIFSKRLFSQGAVPYLVMFSVIIINVIIYHSVKREVQRKIDKKINSVKLESPRKRMDEVKRINRKVLKF